MDTQISGEVVISLFTLFGTKFDYESDSDVTSAVAPQKLSQFDERRISDMKCSPETVFCVKTGNVGNRPKRVLAKFRVDLSHFQGVIDFFNQAIEQN